MATPLRCPHCAADFDFAAWQKAASCPACGRRVRFEDAVATAAATPASAAAVAEVVATDGHAAIAAPPPAGPAPPALPTTDPRAATAAASIAATSAAGNAESWRYFFGRPLRWTRAWTVVVLVWAVAACGLVAARVEAGHGAVLTSRERVAIVAVQRAPLETGVTYGEALRRVEKRLGVSSTSARWYVQDRAWEKTLAVHRVLGGDDLSWTVSYGGRVAPDSGTAGIMKELMQAGAGQPGGLPSLPPIPTL